MIKLNSVNRRAEIRNNLSQIIDIETSESSHYLLWYQGQVITFNRSQQYFSYTQIQKLSNLIHKPIYLGHHQQRDYFACQLTSMDVSLQQFELMDLRTAALHVQSHHLGLLFYAQGLFNWHNSHQFCASCGSPSEHSASGHSRTCTNTACKKEHFPRIEPAVIFAVYHQSQNEQKILLARQASWGENLFSVLAGFVEPGESIEQAVVRECLEEVGLAVNKVNYITSQPWPFPSSLMLGFECSSEQLAIELIDQELETAQWFSAQELTQALNAKTLRLPYSMSISWYLIDRWYQQQTGQSLRTIIES